MVKNILLASLALAIFEYAQFCKHIDYLINLVFLLGGYCKMLYQYMTDYELQACELLV